MLPDVNVLVYAHREDAPHHAGCREWLEAVVNGNESYGLSALVLSSFVRMYHADHGPAHIHVECQGHEALVEIDTGEILAGKLPGRAIRLVREWAEQHRPE